MPVLDFVARVRRLAHIPSSALADLLSDGTATWDAHKENTARLLEVETHRLELEWAKHTYDPEDPENRRAAAEAKRNGVKPPPKPIVPPVALRPRDLAEQRFQQYLDEITAHYEPRHERAPVSRAEFDAALGLD